MKKTIILRYCVWLRKYQKNNSFGKLFTEVAINYGSPKLYWKPYDNDNVACST